ncbi:vps9 domain protein [Ophiostoma piceae UAMH 11346]|uniref:Vps9 domain protein n=1 Tax=Ophiostoma piceae (strain UAMH 11346) TaxID=1262450 RepID=S3C2T1_OPHP1|nr:vps9 domain protein [Ophiostoma piceae UAMH 11346]
MADTKAPSVTLEGASPEMAPSDDTSKTAAAHAEPETSDADLDISEPPRGSIDLDDLPIELIGMADSFIESLQAKVYPTPPNIDNLSLKFQDFYATASSHIGTHIAALVTRQNRELVPAAPPIATRSSAASILRAKAASIGNRDKSSTQPPVAAKSGPEQRMLSSEEIAERKRARRVLESKRGLMEEAVERRLCEGIYSRIYRHRTTQDEAQDEKLRSKIAALDVVGISPADLGVDLGMPADATPEAIAARLGDVRQWLEPARKELVQMGQTHYPLGKLNRLKAAHKQIVETLSHFHPSSSADEIMPMLIYTLITLPPGQLNVVSDLNFIQRFRWEPKIEGETAYCLTNLEASISFLETVDLSTLRADEAPSGPAKSDAGHDAAKTETFPPAYIAQQGLAVPTAATPSAPEISSGQAAASGIRSTPSPSAGLIAAVQMRNRRLSDLVNTPANALSSASDAVMNTFNAADQSLKTIGNSLEGSYRLLVGRLGQPQQRAALLGNTKGVLDGKISDDAAADLVLPKTLDDARKLVTTPPPLTSEDEEALISGDEPQKQHDQTPQTTPPPPQQQRNTFRRLTSGREDKMLTMLGGGRSKAASRDPSADSARSVSSNPRRGLAGTSFASASAPAADDDASSIATAASASAASAAGPPAAGANNPALLDSVRSLGNSFNPMSRLSSIGNFRGFGRTASTPAPSASAAEKTDGGDLATAFPDIAAALPPKPHIAPPVKRFMELHNPADLRISEVMELLRDYRRLATALKEMDAFKD